MADKKRKTAKKSGKKPKKRKKGVEISADKKARRKARGLKPMSKKSLANLKPIRVGDERPKKRGLLSMTHLLRKALEAPAPGSNRGKRERKTRAELVIKKILKFANSNRSEVAAPFIRMILQRVDGKPADTNATELANRERASLMDDVERAAIAAIPNEKSRQEFLAALGIEPVGVDEILLNADKTKAEPDTKQEALNFYQSIIADKTNPAAVRLRAQERIDALLGHVKNESGPSNPEEQAEQIRNFLTELARKGGARKAESGGNAGQGGDDGGVIGAETGAP